MIINTRFKIGEAVQVVNSENPFFKRIGTVWSYSLVCEEILYNLILFEPVNYKENAMTSKEFTITVGENELMSIWDKSKILK